MISKFLIATAISLSFVANAMAGAIWTRKENIDDFDDSKTFLSILSEAKNGALIVRFHEKDTSNYEVYFSPNGYHHFCGESGSYINESSYANVQVRIDGGEVMNFAGGLSVDNEAVFLEDGNAHKLSTLVEELKTAEKVVIRFKDKCHEDGLVWVFGKFSEIAGPHYLDQIDLQ